jgi:hypothetical protein
MKDESKIAHHQPREHQSTHQQRRKGANGIHDTLLLLPHVKIARDLSTHVNFLLFLFLVLFRVANTLYILNIFFATVTIIIIIIRSI